MPNWAAILRTDGDAGGGKPGTSGGHYFLCRMPDAVLVHGWMPIDAES